MSFLLKDSVRGTTIESILNDIFSIRGNFYYFIGNILPRADPLNPDLPIDTQSYEYETRNQILFVKKITVADVSFVIPRVNWVSGTVYDRFDGDYSESNPSVTGAKNLRSAKFYVLNSFFNVYKCIDNNNGIPSTVEPSGTDLGVIITADGYVWKFLYTIPLSSRNKFFTETLMPVQRSVLNPFYSNGEISRVVVNNRGSGYFGNLQTTLSVNGTFESNVGNIVAELIPVLNNGGSFIDVKIKNSGNNYSTANITINDNAGSGTSFYKNLINATITDPGSGYTSDVRNNTTATIVTVGSQPQVPAQVELQYNANSVVNITITKPGNGYTPAIASATSLVISTSGNAQPTANASGQLTFATTARLTPVLLNGSIDKVIIEDQGLGYQSNNQTSISVIGDGSNVDLFPFINDIGELEDVVIVNRGEGYTFLNLAVIGDGSNASIAADLSEGDLDTNQSSVELSAVDGALHSFRIINPGVNYTSANIFILGDGRDFAGNVILSTQNTIAGIAIDNPGIGYTFANVQIVGNGSNAEVTAIISPPGGHGRDSVRELFANTILFYSTINNERIHGIEIDNDYRQFGIIKDIKQFGNERAFANVNGTASYLVTLDTLLDSQSNQLQQDTTLQLLAQNFRKFEVVDVDMANTQVILKNLNNFNIAAGNVLFEPITNSNFTIVSVDREPSINKFSGDLLFIDNRTHVSYSDQQTVTFKTSIKI